MKKRILFSGIALAVLAVVCAWWFWWPTYKAESAVKLALNDPDSAKFSFVEFHRKTGGTCGVVNAKNRMGGFVGGTRFSITKDGDVRFEPRGDMDTGSPKEKMDEISKKIEFLEFAVANCPET